VSANEVQLDYADTSVQEFNHDLENDLGIVRLRFPSPGLKSIPTVDWFDSTTKKWTLNYGDFSWPSVRKLDLYRLPVGGNAKRRLAPVKERPGQKEFRLRLFDAYGGVCLLTGCTVEEAIDGAHIDPYKGKKFDHPQNGLLLRKDLHCLFDSNLLGIEPTTGVAYFGTAQAQVAYAELHGKCRLSPPHALFSDHAPSPDALQRRWKKFCAAHGNPWKN
jgi:hypothetical protein